MDRLIAYIVRLFLVTLGYGCAILAASLFLHALILPGVDLSTPEAEWFFYGNLIVSVPFLALTLGYLGFFPAALAIGIGELAGLRGWLYYALAGGAISVIVIAALQTGIVSEEIGVSPAPSGQPAFPGTTVAVTAASMLAGIVYWLVAGRNAGRWREAEAN